MKTIILAGGYATRLRPLTDNTPKHLLPIKDKPMINYLLEQLDKADMDHWYLVTNNKFAHNFEEWAAQSQWKDKLTIVNDQTTSNEDRLGSLGDIMYVIRQENIDEDLLIVGADNLCDVDFAAMQQHFEQHKQPLIAVYDVGNLETAKQMGICAVNEQGVVTEFVEKPEQPPSTLSSTLIYFLPAKDIPKIQDCIDHGKSDKAGWLIEQLVNQEEVHAITHRGFWIDIGTKETYKEAQDFFTSSPKE